MSAIVSLNASRLSRALSAIALLQACGQAWCGPVEVSPPGAEPRLLQPGSPSIVSANFGLMHEVGASQIVLAPTTDIPNKPGTLYGWQIIVQPFARKIDWRAELIGPPATGSAAGSANISTSQGTVESGQNAVAGAWQVASDDESGEYQVKVYLNGRLAAAFRFNLH